MIKVFIFCFITIMISHVSLVRAEYVLPYPSFMPGNTLYKFSTILDGLKRYWHFGSIAQLKYHISLSDKKLVEAKTLFEYKQYALAMHAMRLSTDHIRFISPLLSAISDSGIDSAQFKRLVCDEMLAHETVLKTLQSFLPSSFSWQEEKKDAVVLSIKETLYESIQVRSVLGLSVCQ